MDGLTAQTRFQVDWEGQNEEVREPGFNEEGVQTAKIVKMVKNISLVGIKPPKPPKWSKLSAKM